MFNFANFIDGKYFYLHWSYWWYSCTSFYRFTDHPQLFLYEWLITDLCSFSHWYKYLCLLYKNCLYIKNKNILVYVLPLCYGELWKLKALPLQRMNSVTYHCPNKLKMQSSLMYAAGVWVITSLVCQLHVKTAYDLILPHQCKILFLKDIPENVIKKK